MISLLLALIFGASAAEPTLQDARNALVAGQPEVAAEILAHQAEHGHEVDPVEVRVLEGLIAQARGNHDTAVWSFRDALAQQPERTSVHLYLGQSLAAVGAFGEARAALIAGEGPGEALPSYYALRARVDLELEEIPAAWATLERGLARFPEEPSLRREAALTLLQLSLYRAASAEARLWLASRAGDRTAWLVTADAQRAAGDYDGARDILEEARLRFPGDYEVLVRLAYTWARLEQPLIAARHYQEAHGIQPVHAFEIAEQLRAAGKTREALYYNASVENPAQKYPQRLAILSALESWDRASALHEPLMGLADLDDASRYQLAFALFHAHDRVRLTALRDSITDPWLQEGVDELLQAPSPW